MIGQALNLTFPKRRLLAINRETRNNEREIRLMAGDRNLLSQGWHLTFDQTFLDMDQLLPNSLNLMADPWKRLSKSKRCHHERSTPASSHTIFLFLYSGGWMGVEGALIRKRFHWPPEISSGTVFAAANKHNLFLSGSEIKKCRKLSKVLISFLILQVRSKT